MVITRHQSPCNGRLSNKNDYPHNLLIFSKRLANDRPRPVSQKISEKGVKNRPCLKLKFVMLFFKICKVWTNFNKFGRFSRSSANFLSEAGAVLNFFASFFGSSQKMKWGFRGKAPIGFIYLLCGLSYLFSCFYLCLLIENIYHFPSLGGGWERSSPFSIFSALPHAHNLHT